MTNIQDIHSLPIDRLQPNPFQPRDKIEVEDLGDIIESIKQYGILEPLVVAETPAGFQIIAGERRWRAAKKVGLTEVPVVVRTTNPQGMLEMAIIENIHRTDLSALERARAYQQLKVEFGYTVSQIADRVSKSSSAVSNTLRLLDLPDAIADGLSGGSITEGHARALLTIDDEKKMLECYKLILKESASVRRTEDLTRRFNADPSKTSKDTKDISPLLDSWQTQLSRIFAKKTKVKFTQSKRQTTLKLTFSGKPESVEHEIEKLIKLTEK